MLQLVARATDVATLDALKEQITDALNADEFSKENYDLVSEALAARLAVVLSNKEPEGFLGDGKSVRIYGKYLSGHYPKQGIRFVNGILVVTQEKLAQLKNTKYWNREISLKPFPGREPVNVKNTNPVD